MNIKKDSRIFLFALFFFLGCKTTDNLQSKTATFGDKALEPGNPAYGATVSFMQVNCTGTLISKRTVITAAHCVDGLDTIEVVLGSEAWSGKVEIHPEYHRFTTHNLWYC